MSTLPSVNGNVCSDNTFGHPQGSYDLLTLTAKSGKQGGHEMGRESTDANLRARCRN